MDLIMAAQTFCLWQNRRNSGMSRARVEDGMLSGCPFDGSNPQQKERRRIANDIAG
jgi:hypothetical protein